LPSDSTLGNLAAVLAQRHGSEWAGLPLLYAVNHEYADENTILKDGDEVGILYPASGG
jgi:molybdopterin converting factor small subunit